MIQTRPVATIAAMANYLGNSNTSEIHNLDNETTDCKIGEIKSDHRVYFSSLAAAHASGYDNCSHCIGSSKR